MMSTLGVLLTICLLLFSVTALPLDGDQPADRAAERMQIEQHPLFDKERGMLVKMEEVTGHLQDLTKSMAELDRDLQEAVLMNRVKDGVSKRHSSRNNRDDNDVNCRLHLHEDICQVWEMLQEQSGFLRSPTSPGKRSADAPAQNYRKLAADLKEKREMLHGLSDVFQNAAYILEREKKWMTCYLNLGFTCQTEEYSKIADYYDFLNSADSPGKKRSAPEQLSGNA